MSRIIAIRSLRVILFKAVKRTCLQVLPFPNILYLNCIIVRYLAFDKGKRHQKMQERKSARILRFRAAQKKGNTAAKRNFTPCGLLKYTARGYNESGE